MDIDIALDHYDDIFSDFDIRDYRKREVSLDFLGEVYRRLKGLEHCPKSLRLVLTVPKEERDKKVERVVAKRIREIFALRADAYERRIRRKTAEGVFFVAVGLAILFLSVLTSHFMDAESLAADLVAEFLFLPSWFFTWNGLERIIEAHTTLKRKKDLYTCLEKAKVVFEDEEEFL